MPAYGDAVDGILEQVLRWEGGVKDVGDGRGVTSFGQTPDWLKRWKFPVPRSRSQAAQNYRAWLQKSGLGIVCVTDDALALLVVDWAIHSGESLAVKALQRQIGVVADGVIGPKTRAAIPETPHARLVTALALLADRMRQQGKLITNRPMNAAYAHGWANRLADHLDRATAREIL